MLKEFVADFTETLITIDKTAPPAFNHRSGKTYSPGIGPYQETEAIRLIVEALQDQYPEKYSDIVMLF